MNVQLLFFIGTTLTAQPSAADLVDVTYDDAGNIRRFTVDPSITVAPSDFIGDYGAIVWNLGPGDLVTEVAARPGPNGTIIHIYSQAHHGIPVSRGWLTLSSRNGRVIQGLSTLAGELASATTPLINEAHAQQLGSDAVQAALGLKKKPHLELGMPIGRLVLDREHVLVWRMVYSVSRVHSTRIVVEIDAQTGALRRLRASDSRAWTPQITPGVDTGGDPINVFSERDDGPNRIRLRYAPYNISTLDGQSQPPGSSWADWEEIGTAFTAASARGAVAQHGITQTYNYLATRFNHQGFNGSGGGINAYVDVLLIPDAMYDRENDRILVPTPDIMPELAFDVMAHEAIHVLEGKMIQGYQYGGFEPEGDADALSEGFADIFAVMVEHFAENDLNWSLGEDMGGIPLRHINDATLPGSLEPGFIDYLAPGFHLADPHEQAGVIGRWFYLTSIGGSGIYSGTPWTVTGVGLEKSQAIAFYTLLNLNASADFYLTRDASITVTRALCGYESSEEKQVTTAWFSVGVDDNWVDDEAILPPDGATGVAPWPATIAWQIYPGENTWELQLDTAENFQSADLRVFPVTDMIEVDGITYAYKEVNVRPNEKYYWRVRANLPESNELSPCWRVTRTFTSDPYGPDIRGPDSGDADVHPWGMGLRWFQRQGTVVYHVEGSDDALGLLYQREIFPEDPACGIPSQCQTTIDTIGDSIFSWTVQALGPTDVYAPNESVITESGAFSTAKPTTEIYNPVPGEPVHPWHIRVYWHETVHASEYQLSAGAEQPGGPITVFAPQRDETVFVTAHFNEEGVTVPLQVTPKKFIQPDLGPFLVDTGEPSPIVSVQNRGSVTIPCVSSPWNFCDVFDPNFSEDPPEIPYGDDVYFSWSEVLYALGYRVTFYPFLDSPSPEHFRVDFNDVITSFELMSETGLPQDAPLGTLAGGQLASSPFDGTSVYGTWYTIQAIGPEGLLSPISHIGTGPYNILGDFTDQLGDNLFLIDPPAVSASDQAFDYAASGNVYVDGNGDIPITINQSPLYRPEGTFDVQLHNGGDCDDLNVGGESSGTLIMIGNTERNTLYSFRARVHTEYGAFFPWSNCLEFRTASAADYCGNATIDEGEECDDGNETATDGCTNTCQVRFPCNQPIPYEGGPQDQTFDIDLGVTEAQSGQAYLVFNTFDIPDRIRVTYEGAELQDTDCYGSMGALAYPLASFSGSSTQVHVEVDANCDPTDNGETRWIFTITCPEDSATDPGGTPE